MTERRTAAAAAVVLAAALLLVVLVTTPWTPLAGVPHSDPATDFTTAEIARQQDFRADLLPWTTLSWVLSLLVPLVVGFSPLGRRLADALRVRRWYLVVPLVVIVVGLAGNLLTLPSGIVAERGLRRWGLSTQDWGSWTRDRAVGWVIGTVALVLLALLLVGMSRRWPHWWWVPAGLSAATLVVVVSFAYPVLVEPQFNAFTPMPAGAQRDQLLAMAAADGVPVRDVLVADASRRTTSLNAYVSGFGSTRRIVVYDTLLRKSPDDVRLVVAHELGHAKHADVLRGTLVGALAAFFAVALLRLLAGSFADPRRTALLLALMTAGSAIAAPAQNLISRRIETRADLHALDVTREPAAFASTEHALAVTNLSALDPAPWRFAMFADHPTPPQRISLARTWGAQHGIALAPLARR
jgi:STE24 endopeptidase